MFCEIGYSLMVYLNFSVVLTDYPHTLKIKLTQIKIREKKLNIQENMVDKSNTVCLKVIQSLS